MTVLCKYTRLGAASLVSHLDLMRSMMMAVRRAGIKVKFSEGYNPHMQLYFNQPLPLGIESECEYFYAITDVSADEFMAKLNAQLQNGVRILRCVSLDRDPKIAKIMSLAEYMCTMRDITPINKLDEEINNLLNSTEYTVTYEKSKKTETKQIRSLVKNIVKVSNSVYALTLSCGNSNLRADRLLDEMLCRIGETCKEKAYYDITKTRTFTADGRDIDEIFNVKS